MHTGVELNIEQTLPPEMVTVIENYYVDLLGEPGRAAAEGAVREFGGLAAAIIYRLAATGQPSGFALVDTRTSTIKGLFLQGSADDRALEDAVFSALLEKHKLVSIEVPADDVRRIESLTERGFRPAAEFAVGAVAMLRMELCIAVYLDHIRGKTPPAYHQKETVAIERVAPSHGDMDIKAGLGRLLDNLGGLDRFLKPGQTVVLKPNLVSEHGLKDGVKNGGVATDIRVIEALVALLLPVAGDIVIAEGSSINRSETTRMFTHYGLDRLAATHKDKVRLVDLNADDCRMMEIPDGRRQAEREIPRTLLEADLVINMPVLKLHFAAGASLSIKNLQGAIGPLEKYKVHFFGLWQNLINTYKIIKPGLTIIDGLYGQEGFGPISGTPRKMDLLIGGTNPVALDSVAMRLMGLDPADSPPVLMACHEGLGPMDPEMITVRGVPVDTAATAFERPRIDLSGGKRFAVHDGNACPGCRGYLHFTLNKLRRPDPGGDGLLIDRAMEKPVNLYLGPETPQTPDPDATNIFMGACQRHNAAGGGLHLPGCPPHTEEIIGGIFGLYPDIRRPGYADKSEESKLGDLLKTILASNQ